MIPVIRPARLEDCDAVAVMVRELARDTGAGVVPKASGPELASNLFGPAPLLRLLVAESGGTLLAYCLSLVLFSTWRNSRGLHVIDLYVRPAARSLHLGENLLAEAAAAGLAEGATFIRLEVERGNGGAERFYQRFGFRRKDNEIHYSLDTGPMRALAQRKD